jgi:hypothetical protein
MDSALAEAGLSDSCKQQRGKNAATADNTAAVPHLLGALLYELVQVHHPPEVVLALRV